MIIQRLLCIALCLVPLSAGADAPVIEGVTAREGAEALTFDVTLSHPDTGWDHYADGWRILDMDGKELGIRILYHPHVEEQPFTRSLGGITVPAGTTQVQIQARCLIDGWSDQTTIVTLP